jgi:hypothetical protein
MKDCENARRPVEPPVPLHDPRFHYTPAAATDVQRTWAKYGWMPPSKREVAHEHHA